MSSKDVDDKKKNTKGALSAGFNKAFTLTDESEIVDKVSKVVL